MGNWIRIVFVHFQIMKIIYFDYESRHLMIINFFDELMIINLFGFTHLSRYITPSKKG